MENLPFVVLKKLFKMMPDRNETIKCSQVCRNWRAAYEMAIERESLFLNFEEFLPLNYLLFYTNEPVVESFFLRLPSDPKLELEIPFRFLSSDATRVHFANLRKLVIFPLKYAHKEVCEFSFKKQLNHFQNLEHLELYSWSFTTEDYEIDLPKLKIFHLFDGIVEKNNKTRDKKIVLKTPSLQVLRTRFMKITKFKFRSPRQLKYLDATIPGSGFKFETEFSNLECLVLFTENSPKFFKHERDRPIYKLDEDFFEELPNLKFLFVPRDEYDYSALSAAKRKFNLEDVKILDLENEYYDEFGYTNWHRYVEHRQQLRRWPNHFCVEFTKLINCKIALSHFKENYLRIFLLTVRHVTSEPLLIEFLRNVKIEILSLDYDFNLGQSFFDEIADFLTVRSIYSYGSALAGVSDPSVLSRMKFDEFELKYDQYDQFPRQVVLAILQNPSCRKSTFSHYSEMIADLDEENRKIPKDLDYRFLHRIRRENGVFYCLQCVWSSAKDPKCSQDLLGAMIHHIENAPSPRNTTYAEISHIIQ